MFHFIRFKDEILVQKPPTSLHEKTLRQWGSIFLCVRPHGADPSPSACVHLSLIPCLSVWTS